MNLLIGDAEETHTFEEEDPETRQTMKKVTRI